MSERTGSLADLTSVATIEDKAGNEVVNFVFDLARFEAAEMTGLLVVLPFFFLFLLLFFFFFFLFFRRIFCRSIDSTNLAVSYAPVEFAAI